jgi:hypothetical protein
VALSVFSGVWPYLSSTVGFFVGARDSETLELVVAVYAAAIPLLYTHEFLPILPSLLSSAQALYTQVALPAVLDLYASILACGNLGIQPELREQWAHLFPAVYRSTILAARSSDASGKSSLTLHVDLVSSFFSYARAGLLYSTTTFVTNHAGNTLTQILQLCVGTLDALHAHRGPLIKCLSFLEELLGNRAVVECLAQEEKAQVKEAIAQVYAEQGGGLIRQPAVGERGTIRGTHARMATQWTEQCVRQRRLRAYHIGASHVLPRAGVAAPQSQIAVGILLEDVF